MKILVTGANGFIGKELCTMLLSQGHTICGAVRKKELTLHFPQTIVPFVIGDINHNTDWRHTLDGVDAIVHLAARVHVMKEVATDPLSEFQRVNVGGTIRLAEQAQSAGVKRLIFISSIKVNGETTDGRPPFNTEEPPNPTDPYGQSKLEAEKALTEIGKTMGITILRPPLVYGPGVKGNFRLLIRLLNMRLPLPFASINNRRSFVSLGNLCAFIALCLENPDASGETFLISDGEDLSISDLMNRLGKAINRPPFLFPFPRSLLESSMRMGGLEHTAKRMFSSLELDTTKVRRLLGWHPPFTVDDELRRLYLAEREAGML